jgi:AcrR family transcriptional regulator
VQLKSVHGKRKGRPQQHEALALIAGILETAARLFKEQGYAATSIEQIASRSGSGKQTIYRRFSSKELLFQAVMDSHTASVALRVCKGAVNDDPLVALRNTTREMFDHMLSADSVAFHRVLIAEASRFPALVSRTFDHTIGPFSALTVSLLRAAVVTGQLRLADPERLFGLLTGLLTGWPHQQALLGREVLATAAARSQYFDAAWTVFLSGAAP